MDMRRPRQSPDTTSLESRSRTNSPSRTVLRPGVLDPGRTGLRQTSHRARQPTSSLSAVFRLHTLERRTGMAYRVFASALVQAWPEMSDRLTGGQLDPVPVCATRRTT